MCLDVWFRRRNLRQRRRNYTNMCLSWPLLASPGLSWPLLASPGLAWSLLVSPGSYRYVLYLVYLPYIMYLSYLLHHLLHLSCCLIIDLRFCLITAYDTNVVYIDFWCTLPSGHRLVSIIIQSTSFMLPDCFFSSLSLTLTDGSITCLSCFAVCA